MNSEQIPASGTKHPTFAYSGHLASTNCSLEEPFDGHLNCILEPDMEIKSIESQLRRIETYSGKTQSTEIQNIQISDGNILPNLEVPIYWLFPKGFSCPTFVHAVFKIEYEMKMIFIFKDGYEYSESFPLHLYR